MPKIEDLNQQLSQQQPLETGDVPFLGGEEPSMFLGGEAQAGPTEPTVPRPESLTKIPDSIIPIPTEKPGLLRRTFGAVSQFGSKVENFLTASTKESARIFANSITSAERTGNVQDAVVAASQYQNTLIQRAKDLPVGSDERKQLLGQAKHIAEINSLMAENEMKGIPTDLQGVGAVTELVLTGALPFTSSAKSVIVNQGWKTFAKTAAVRAFTQTGPTIGLFSAAEAAKQPESTLEGTAKAGAFGYALGTAGSLIASTLKFGITQGITKLLSATSGRPEPVKRLVTNPQAVKEGMQKPVDETLTEAQGVVKDLRTRLSQGYDEGKQAIIEKFSGKRTSFSDKEWKLVQKLAEQFPEISDALPQNPTNVSVKEAIELGKAINAQFTPNLEKEAEGAGLRYVRNFFRKKLTDSFGGAGQGVDQFLTDYGQKAGAINRVDKILSSYKTGDPGSQRSALRALKSLWDPDNLFHRRALEDLFQKAGRPEIMDKIAGIQFQNWFPKGDIGYKNFIGVIKSLVFPLTSPKATAYEVDMLRKLAESGLTSAPVRTILLKLISRAITPKEAAKKIENVSKPWLKELPQ